MKAIVFHEHGDPSVLRYTEVAEPKIGPAEVLVRVRACALNHLDLWVRRGLPGISIPLPHIPGSDISGEVARVGESVTRVKVGQRVLLAPGISCGQCPQCLAGEDNLCRRYTLFGYMVDGGCAEYVKSPEVNVIPIPGDLSFEEAAAVPLVFLTAWQALTQWGTPGAGAVLLVTGASGGVGVASVMLGKSLGLTVVGLSRSAAKGERLKELGADFVFDPADPALPKKVLAAVEPRKVDLAVDNVGGPAFNSLLMTLGYGGRVSVVGASGGPVPDFRTPLLFFKRNKIGGVAVGDYTAESAQEAWAGIVARLNAMGRRPVIDSVFAFEDVKKAFARLDEGPMGKVLVRIRS